MTDTEHLYMYVCPTCDHLLLCAVQVCKMILKIDDIIQPSQYE